MYWNWHGQAGGQTVVVGAAVVVDGVATLNEIGGWRAQPAPQGGPPVAAFMLQLHCFSAGMA